MTRRRAKFRSWALGGVLACLGVVPAGAGQSEVWVVNAGSRDVMIVDPMQESVIGTIPLTGDETAAEPSALAFSTIDGEADFAFVAQGAELHVIDASVQGVTATFDVAQDLGVPDVTLVDLAQAPNRVFETNPPGGSLVESYLLAVADVGAGGGQLPEPYYIVFDQRVLTGVAPPGSPAIVDEGPLLPASIPPGDRGQATGVAVLGAPHGTAYQRAWFTTRAATIVRSILLSKGSTVTDAWTVDKIREDAVVAGATLPDRLAVAAPYDREMPVLPLGDTLINTDTGGSCTLGGELRDVAISGVGPGAYHVFTIDGAAEQVLRVNPLSCETESFPTESNPVAVASAAIGGRGKAFVANRDSDSVTVLRLDGTVTHVPLGAGGVGPCEVCPVEVEVRRCCWGCTIENLRFTVQSSVHDFLGWDRVGCGNCLTGVFCQCRNPTDTECPCYCPPESSIALGSDPQCYGTLPPPNAYGSGAVLEDDGPDMTETPWKQLGVVGGTGYTHVNAAPHALNYAVIPLAP